MTMVKRMKAKTGFPPSQAEITRMQKADMEKRLNRIVKRVKAKSKGSKSR
jgi:hypothetical protein